MGLFDNPQNRRPSLFNRINAVRDVQQSESDYRPEVEEPVPEEYLGTVLPGYRGSELHGVEAAMYDTSEPPYEESQGGIVMIQTMAEQEPTPVVPVRIVAESAKEQERWSTTQLTVSSAPVQIVGRNVRRTKLKIKNLDDLVVVYLASTAESASFEQGYPVDPGESFELIGSDQVWAVSADTDIILAIMQEYTVG